MSERWRDFGLLVVFIGFMINVIGLSIVLFFNLDFGWFLVFMGLGIEFIGVLINTAN